MVEILRVFNIYEIGLLLQAVFVIKERELALLRGPSRPILLRGELYGYVLYFKELMPAHLVSPDFPCIFQGREYPLLAVYLEDSEVQAIL